MFYVSRDIFSQRIRTLETSMIAKMDEWCRKCKHAVILYIWYNLLNIVVSIPYC